MSDLDTIRALVLENEALKHEVLLRNAIVLELMEDSPQTLKLISVNGRYGQTPVYSQTKTLLKLTPPTEES